MDIYEGCTAIIMTNVGNTEEIKLDIGLCMGSTLTPLLFSSWTRLEMRSSNNFWDMLL